jgi:uncharacterized protein (DUF1499 family)
MLGVQEDYYVMVELDSYSSLDRSDSGVNRDKAEALRPGSSEANSSI